MNNLRTELSHRKKNFGFIIQDITKKISQVEMYYSYCFILK